MFEFSDFIAIRRSLGRNTFTANHPFVYVICRKGIKAFMGRYSPERLGFVG